MIVLDPPERGPRVYTRQWTASAWRGSLDEIVGAIQTARDEMDRQGVRHVSETAILDYKDGSSERISSLDALRDMIGSADPAEVKEITVRLEGGTPLVRLKGTAEHGLSVTAEGSEAFAAGMVATLKSRLTGGAEAGEVMTLVPIRPTQRFLIALSPILMAAVVYYLGFEKGEEISVVVAMSVTIGLIPAFIGFGSLADDYRNSNPVRFVLVPEGEQFPDEPRDGPVWRAKAWFDRHPLVKVLLTLLVGALIAHGVDGLLS